MCLPILAVLEELDTPILALDAELEGWNGWSSVGEMGLSSLMTVMASDLRFPPIRLRFACAFASSSSSLVASSNVDESLLYCGLALAVCLSGAFIIGGASDRSFPESW